MSLDPELVSGEESMMPLALSNILKEAGMDEREVTDLNIYYETVLKNRNRRNPIFETWRGDETKGKRLGKDLVRRCSEDVHGSFGRSVRYDAPNPELKALLIIVDYALNSKVKLSGLEIEAIDEISAILDRRVLRQSKTTLDNRMDILVMRDEARNELNKRNLSLQAEKSAGVAVAAFLKNQ